jgi:hypothetical protein
MSTVKTESLISVSLSTKRRRVDSNLARTDSTNGATLETVMYFSPSSSSLDHAGDLFYHFQVQPVVVTEVVDLGGNKGFARGITLVNQSGLVCAKRCSMRVGTPPPRLDRILQGGVINVCKSAHLTAWSNCEINAC